jgi:hypothetical protein
MISTISHSLTRPGCFQVRVGTGGVHVVSLNPRSCTCRKSECAHLRFATLHAHKVERYRFIRIEDSK